MKELGAHRRRVGNARKKDAIAPDPSGGMMAETSSALREAQQWRRLEVGPVMKGQASPQNSNCIDNHPSAKVWLEWPSNLTQTASRTLAENTRCSGRMFGECQGLITASYPFAQP
jgi:hypothetical protein